MTEQQAAELIAAAKALNLGLFVIWLTLLAAWFWGVLMITVFKDR